MTFNYLQVCVLISTFVSTLDPFESENWVEIPAVGRATAIKTAADRLSVLMAALIWEATFCAAPAINGVTVEVEVSCITHAADYSNTIIPKYDTTFTKWSPELSAHMEHECAKIKADMVGLLTDLAAAHFDGAASEGGGRYVIRIRD